MPDRGLGRLPEKKPEQANYPLRAILGDPVKEVELPSYKYWTRRVGPLDQGQTGTCVGHAWAHRIEISPVRYPDVAVDPFQIYLLACGKDPWSGNDDGDLQFGTSVDAGALAARELGYIESFFWAEDFRDADEFVSLRGPLVIGINWYRKCSEPVLKKIGSSERYMMEASGPLEGGHAIALTGRNRKLGIWQFFNTWGTEFGDDGVAYMTDETFSRLVFDEDGEACAPYEAPRGG